MAEPCRPKIAPDAPTDGPALVSMLTTLPAMPLITKRNANCTRPNACSHTMPSTKSATALPTRCSTLPCRKIAETTRHHSPPSTAARDSAPAWRKASGESSTSAPSSVRKMAASTRTRPTVTGGRRRIRRSKSTRRRRTMSGVIRSGCSAPSTSAALARVEHDAGGEGQAAIERALGVRGEVEHVAIEQRELAVELAEHLAVDTLEEKVRAQESEERAEDPPQQRQHDGLLDGERDDRPVRGLDRPLLADEVARVVLAE